MRWIKRIVVLLVLVAIAAALVWSMLPKPVPAQTAAVTRGPLEVTVDEDGRARVHDRHVVVAPLAGLLGRIELHAGDAVTEETVVARIAPMASPLLDVRSRKELEGRLAIARAQRRQVLSVVERARTAADYARQEAERGQALAAKGALPTAERDRRNLEADIAARDLDSARFAASVAANEVRTVEGLLARATSGSKEDVEVRAPITGQVLRVFTESEGVVQPGTPLVEVGDRSRLEIAADVLTADAVGIRPGADVSIEAWGGPPLVGIVRLVEPSAVTKISALGVEEQRVVVVIDLCDEPGAWAALGDGWRVEVRIVTWKGDDVVTVPLGAVFRAGEAWAVFVVEDGRARRRLVELGQRSGAAAEVLSGLAEGERVILHPSERIRDDVRVEPR